ncbi:DUF637 domain-containing protein [Pseudomonas typographi]|uniref:DUF637 domain-containing protein n=1 Tax=Pseudomonas typographi TaxID=2715964 RepID=UPI0030B8AC93
MSIDAGRDISAIASQLDATRDISMAATEDLTLSAAANEDHYLSKSKKLTTEQDHVSQVATDLTAGGSVTLSAGQDLAVISSRITAGDEAYLVAGGKLDLLAAQDTDYSLYDKNKKGSFGSRETKRDEVTDVVNIGSEITTGGDLLLVSGSDQTYQAAKLQSGGDLAISSGGAVTFEGVKDLHQESHEKSSSSLAWASASGKGSTDETLRQSEMIAQGQVMIEAAQGVAIDIKEVNQQSVSQIIDAMVQAGPNLAWLKDAETRGDVDWRQVKEIHDSFKYSQSGLGVGAQLAIAIVVAYFTAGAASTFLAGTAGATGTTAATSVWATASATTAAGWANAAATAAITSAASGAAVSTLNNRGDVGAVLKEITSSDALKGYAVAGLTAGLTAGMYDKWTSTQTGASTLPGEAGNAGSNLLANSGKVVGGGLGTWSGIGQFAANQALQNTTSAVLNQALGQGGSLGDALQQTLANTFMAAGFNWVGDTGLENGSLAKIGLHAIVGGLAAEALGGDFKTGALAAGVNEALVDTLAKQYVGMTADEKGRLLVMNSQLVGVLTAALGGGWAGLAGGRSGSGQCDGI